MKHAMTPRPGKEGKTFWHRVGTAFENDKGITIVFDSLPLPDKDGKVTVKLFEPRDPQERTTIPAARTNGGTVTSRRDEMDSEIPF